MTCPHCKREVEKPDPKATVLICGRCHRAWAAAAGSDTGGPQS